MRKELEMIKRPKLGIMVRLVEKKTFDVEFAPMDKENNAIDDGWALFNGSVGFNSGSFENEKKALVFFRTLNSAQSWEDLKIAYPRIVP